MTLLCASQENHFDLSISVSVVSFFIIMLFCFSAQSPREDEQYIILTEDEDEDQVDSVEAHDNLINHELLVAAATGKSVEVTSGDRHRRHRRTLSSGVPSAPPLESVKSPTTPRTFRKSTTAAGATAAGKFVDPSLIGSGVDQHNQSSSNSSTGSTTSRVFSKLGPGVVSHLRRNLSQTFRSSKGTEHLQREALRKTQETAAGLGVDQSQRYIRLPTSSPSTNSSSTKPNNNTTSPSSTPKSSSSHPKTSPLTKSHTSVGIAGESRLHQQATSDSGTLSTTKSSSDLVHHKHKPNSPSSSSSSSSPSPSSSSSPPPPTLVPRSANNPPPRPKTNKPSRANQTNLVSSLCTSSSNSSVSSRHQQQSCSPVLHSSTSSISSSSLVDPLSQSSSPSPSPPSQHHHLSHLHHPSASSSQPESTSTLPQHHHSTITTTSTMTSTVTTTTMSTTSMMASTTLSSTASASTSSSSSTTTQSAPCSSSSTASNTLASTACSINSQPAQPSSSHHHHQHQQFINKPPRGWLHPDHKLSDSVGVTYAVRYIGCLGVNTSMKSLDFDTRSLIAKECINRVCEAAGLKTADKKRRTDKRIARMLADSPNMDHAGVDVNLSITSAYLNLVADSGENLAKHEMPNISFASGGDTDTLDFAAYVAKDSRFGRACFVLECGGGRAQDVITTIGQAFELRFKEFLKRTPRALNLENSHFNGTSNNHQQTPPVPPQVRSDDREYYNDLPGKIPPDLLIPTNGTKDAKGAPHAAPRKKNGLTDHSVNLIDLNDEAQSSNSAPSALTSASQTTLINGSFSSTYHAKPSALSANPAIPHDPQYVNCMPSQPTAAAVPQHTTTKEDNHKDPFDMQPFASAIVDEGSTTTNTNTTATTSTSSNSTISNKRIPPVGGPLPPTPSSPSTSDVEFVANSDLYKEEWFHGPISRKESEALVIRDGDFLVRESQVSSGQYVLTGMQSGSRKHLLLVDPEGVVRTKDKTFESVSHLINYHRNNGLPIISSESALVLKYPILTPKSLKHL